MRGIGAEVGRDLLAAGRGARASDLVVDGDVGAAEAVDRLLGVADDRQPPGPGRSVRQSSPGSSSLVSNSASSAWTGSVSWNSSISTARNRSAEVVAGRAAVAQQIARPEQQVIEVGPSRALSLGRVVGHESLDMRQQAEQRVGPQRRLCPVKRVPVGLLQLLQTLLLPAPVGTRAHSEMGVGRPAKQQCPLLLNRIERLELRDPVEDSLDDRHCLVVAGLVLYEHRTN